VPSDHQPPTTERVLGRNESGVSFYVTDAIALGEHEMRRDVAAHILRIFRISNLVVLGAVAVVLVSDWALIALGLQKPTERVIDAGVVKTLIGATTVQVGIIMISISAYLFPRLQRRALLRRGLE